MDKYEYKIRSQEIRDLIAQGEYAAAVEIADTIDWRRVKSVMMLCTISDLYKINRRFEESNEILLLAYNRHPNGRTIVYSLCELAIKMEEFVQAIEYYKEFVQIAPKDTGRYVLQYKLYVAQEVSLEERIEVLEELKKRDYREKWAYELAYLYHRVGLATRCVEECDELILWFGEGKYVTKAMELKMLHQPLTPEQQAKYEGRFEEYQMEQEAAQKVKFQSVDEDNPIDVMNAPTVEIPSGEIADIQVKTVDVGEYNTINLQKELADSMRELWTETPQNKEEEQIPVATEEYFTAQTGELGIVQEEIISEEPALEEQNVIEQVTVFEEAYCEEAKDDNVDTNDESVSVMSSTQKITQAIVAPLFLQTGDISEVAVLLDEDQEPVGEEVSDEGQELDEEPLSDEKQELDEELLSDEKKESDEEEDLVEELQFEPEESQFEPNIPKHREFDDTEQKKTPRPVLKRPEAFDKYLGMEYDGQMSFVLPDADKVEKQITGQLNIEDILAEWERMKKENEQKQAEEVRQLVLQHTGNILVDFDQMTRDSLLEELENSNNEQTAEYEEADVFQQIIAREEAELEELRAEEIEAGVEETGSEEIYFEPENEQEEVAEPVEEAGADTLNVEITEIEEVEEIAEIEEIEEIEEPEEIEEIQEIEEAEEPEEIEEIQEIEETEETEEIEELQEIEEIEETEAVRGIVETGYADSGEADSSVNVEDSLQKIDSNIRDAVSDANPRDLTDEEMELYASYAQDRKTKEQLVKAIDSISLAPYTGNVVITGEEGMDTLGLAKSMMKEVQMMDSNFSGKIAKISGSSMNQRDMAKVISKLNNGALIIENADKMTVETANSLHRALQQENMGIVVIMEGGKKAITKLLEAVPRLGDSFNARINIEALDNDSLVAYGKKYAKEQEYVIDEMGLLALHTRISDRQTSDHSVTLMEVKEIVDEAIVHANKKNIRHFFDVLFAKRYDEEDMIILRENDFI